MNDNQTCTGHAAHSSLKLDAGRKGIPAYQKMHQNQSRILKLIQLLTFS